MRWLLLFFFVGTLHAVSIETHADRSELTSNQTLLVDIEFDRPPDMFPFIYSLLQQPKSSFEVVAYDMVSPTHVRFTLQPMHTGTLIFAPGVSTVEGSEWLVPAVSVECVSSGLTSLPVPALSPLYPERKVDLNTQNRLYLLNQERLLEVQKKNIESYATFRFAWNAITYGIVTIAFSLLLVWCVVYYELLDRAKRPKKVVESRRELLIREVKDERLPLSERWQKLSLLVREVLGAQALGLTELEGYVVSNRNLTSSEKKMLLPAIQTLGAVSYAAKPTNEEEWNRVSRSILKWLR